MKIVLFVEGGTEKELPPFLKRWLDPQLPQQKQIGIQAVSFEGVNHFLENVSIKANLHLASEDTVAIFGLLDL